MSVATILMINSLDHVLLFSHFVWFEFAISCNSFSHVAFVNVFHDTISALRSSPGLNTS